MMRKLVLLATAFFCQGCLFGQAGLGIHFNNYFGPGSSKPFSFMNGNGPLLDDHWKAELLVGPSPDFLTSVGDPVVFYVTAEGEPTGLYFGGLRYPDAAQTFGEKIYSQVRVWGGADSFDTAWYLVRGWTSVFEIPRTGPDAGKLVNMIAPWIGPIQPGFNPTSTITLPGQTFTLTAGVFEFPWQPMNRQWQRQDPATLVWTNIPGATADSIQLPIAGMQDTGWFRLGTAVAPASVAACTVGCSGAAWVGSVLTVARSILVKGPQGGRFRIFTADAIAPHAEWNLFANGLVMGDEPYSIPIPSSEAGARFFKFEPDYWQTPPQAAHP